MPTSTAWPTGSSRSAVRCATWCTPPTRRSPRRSSVATGRTSCCRETSAPCSRPRTTSTSSSTTGPSCPIRNASLPAGTTTRPRARSPSGRASRSTPGRWARCSPRSSPTTGRAAGASSSRPDDRPGACPARRRSVRDDAALDVDDLQPVDLRLARGAVAIESGIHRRMYPFVERAGALLLAGPHVDVAQATPASPHTQVQQQPVHRMGADALDDARVHLIVDRHVLDVGVRHQSPPTLGPNLIRMNIGSINLVTDEVKPPGRRYRSARRAEQAAGTRHRILAAARALFTEQGYTATGVAQIADRAGVAVDTL